MELVKYNFNQNFQLMMIGHIDFEKEVRLGKSTGYCKMEDKNKSQYLLLILSTELSV